MSLFSFLFVYWHAKHNGIDMWWFFDGCLITLSERIESLGSDQLNSVIVMILKPANKTLQNNLPTKIKCTNDILIWNWKKISFHAWNFYVCIE